MEQIASRLGTDWAARKPRCLILNQIKKTLAERTEPSTRNLNTPYCIRPLLLEFLKSSFKPCWSGLKWPLLIFSSLTTDEFWQALYPVYGFLMTYTQFMAFSWLIPSLTSLWLMTFSDIAFLLTQRLIIKHLASSSTYIGLNHVSPRNII